MWYLKKRWSAEDETVEACKKKITLLKTSQHKNAQKKKKKCHIFILLLTLRKYLEHNCDEYLMQVQRSAVVSLLKA